MKTSTIALIVGSLALSCLGDGELKHRNTTIPEDLDDGWTIATPESVGIDPAALARVHQELLREDRYLPALALLVVKDDKLVFETYVRDTADRDHVQHIQSATKSVTSLILGMMLDDGTIESIDRTLGTIFPEELRGLDPRKAGITLADIATMRSGIAFDNQDFSMEMWVDRPAHPVRYILDKPMYADPGERFYYRDADPQLIGYAIDRIAGRTEREIADERLFGPLGIRDVHWETDDDGVPLAAHGLHLRPRDFAKIGRLLLDRGKWQGAPIVSPQWLDAATTPRVAAEGFQYGYYFWIVPDLGFLAAGHGGQYLFVQPEEGLLVVEVSMPDATDLHGDEIGDFLELIEPLLAR